MPRKSRQRASWGSNEDAGDGRRRLRYWADLHDGRGYRRCSKTIRGTRRDGDAELARLRVAHSEDAPVPTVAELWERFELPRLEAGVGDGSVARRTLVGYESKWRVYVAPRFGSVPCDQVRGIDVQEWLLSMSASSGKVCRAVLKNVLDHAVRYDLAPANAAGRNYRYGEETRREESGQTYSEDELAALWEVVRGSVCEVPFLLSAHGGLRVGEACGVALESVSWRDDGAMTVDVVSQLTEDDEAEARLKTRSGSVRRVGIAPPWSARLREIADALPKGAAWLNDRGDGRPVPRWRVHDTWVALLSKAGMRDLGMRALRPSYETIMHWGRKVPLEKMAKIMGHAKPTTTFAYYDRPLSDDVAQLAIDAQRKSGR